MSGLGLRWTDVRTSGIGFGVQLIGWLSPTAEAVAGERLAGLSPVVERIGQQPKRPALEMLGRC